MAEGLVLSLALTSHIGWERAFNYVHPTVSYVYSNYSVGAFRNSLDRTSVFVSRTDDIQGYQVQYGVATNYENTVIPMLMIKKPITENVNFVVSPSYNKTTKQAAVILGLELTYKN